MPVNDTTTNRGYQKPNIANTLADDVGRLRSALDSIDTDMVSKAPTAGPTFTGVTTVAAGSAGAPSLIFTGATSDTGIYSPGADQVAISTGGTGRLFVDASGNFGLGAAPVYPVHVVTSTSDAFYIERNAESVAGPNLGFRTTRGTYSSPSVLLSGDAIGTVQFRGYTGTTSSTGVGLRAVVNGTPSGSRCPADFVVLTDNGTAFGERCRITADGKLAIGTSAPGTELDIALVAGTGTPRVRVSQSADNPFLELQRYSGVVGQHAAARIRAEGATAHLVFEKASTAAIGSQVFTESARIDSSGRLLVGTSSAITAVTFAAQIQSSSFYSYSSSLFSADATSSNFFFLKSRNATTGNHTVVQANDVLGQTQYAGSDGTAFIAGAAISVAVDGTPGTNDMPGRIVLSTTADGASSPTEQLRISNAGTVIYRQPAPAAVDTTATLTVANLTAKIITSSTAAAVTMTLPTGTDMDAGFSGLYTNMAFEWYVINTGGTNAVTVQGNTAHTVVGSGTVSASNSGKFLSRRTAATTWVTYRLSS